MLEKNSVLRSQAEKESAHDVKADHFSQLSVDDNKIIHSILSMHLLGLMRTKTNFTRNLNQGL